MDNLSMKTVDELANKYLSTLNRDTPQGQQHEFIAVCGLMFYIVFIAPKLNKRIIDILDHPASKLVLLAMILLISSKSGPMAIFMTIAVLVTFSSAEKELMTNVDGSVKGNCKCVSWECDGADGNTMSFDSDMDEHMLPGHDPSAMAQHPASSPEELLHAQETMPEIAPEDPTVQVIVEEKAKMEEHLQRALTQEELQTLCADVSNSMPAQSTTAPVESFSNIVGFNGSAYASA